MKYDSNKPHRIDDVEQRLYSPNPDQGIKSRKPLRPKDYQVQSDWGDTNTVVEQGEVTLGEKKSNWFLRFFIMAFIFFVGAMGYAAYIFFMAPNSVSRNIDITVNAPLSIGAGEPFEFEVLIQNKDAQPIVLADVIIEFPDGAREVQNIQNVYRRDSQRVDRIESGTTLKKNYEVLLFGEENEKKDLEILLVYQTEDSTTFFEKRKNFDVVLRSTPVRMTINNVIETTSGQDVTFNVELVSNSTQTLENILIEAFYPFGFTFAESSIAPQEDKKTWIITKIEPRETVNFTIRGKIEGQNNDEKFFRFVTGLAPRDSNDSLIAFNTQDTTIKITRPFLEIAFEVEKNNQPVLVLDPERSYNANLTFRNNAPSPVRNAEVILQIEGDVLRKERISVSEGFYQSLTNLITWDSSTSNKLSTVGIGASERLSFSFTGKGLASEFFIQNPEATLTIGTKANRSSEGAVADVVENTVTRLIKFNTEATIQARSEFYSGIFQNSGPVPPKSENETFYTGVVQVLNTTNQIKDGVVTMRIPNYVQYNGVYSPTSENVSYDSVTRTLTWRVGTVNPSTGYQGNQPKRLYVQVAIIPSISQAGSVPDLINTISFAGTDTHTGTQIQKTSPSITTAIFDTQEFSQGTVTR